MTEKPEDRRPRPKDALFHWTSYTGDLDVLHLRDLCDDLHTHVCGSMPGASIKRIDFDGRELTITLGEAS